MKKVRPCLIPLFVFFFSFAIRFFLISKGPYHVDCLGLVMQIENSIEHGKLFYLYGLGYPLPLIFGILFVSGFKLFSLNDPFFAVNFMSVFFSASAAVVFYFLGKKLFNRTAGLISSLLLAFYPPFLGISVYGNSHSLYFFFLFLSLLMLALFSEKNKPASLILSAAFLGLSGACRIQDFCLMIIPVSVLFFPIQKNTIKNFLVFLSISLCTIFLFYLPLLTESVHSQSFSIFISFAQGGAAANFKGIISDSLKFSSKHFLETLLWPGVLLSLMGFFRLFRENKKIFLFLSLWFLIPLLFYGNLYSTVSRFLILPAAPLLLAQGYFLSKFSQINRFFRLAALGLFLMILFINTSFVISILEFRHRYALLPDYAKWIAQVTEPNAVIVGADHNPFIRYFGKCFCLDRPAGSVSSFDPAQLTEFKMKIDRYLLEGRPVYLTSTGLYSYDPHKQFSNFIKETYRIEKVGEMLCEDWHKGEMILAVGKQDLYRVDFK